MIDEYEIQFDLVPFEWHCNPGNRKEFVSSVKL